jgi:hypothetical protein
MSVADTRWMFIEIQRADATVSAAEASLAFADARIGLLSAQMSALQALAVHLLDMPRAAPGLAGPLASPGANLSEEKFAKLMGVSERTIAKDRTEMTEGLHYHRHGRRVLYHVPEAVEFIRHRKPPVAGDVARVAVDEVTRRRARVALRKSRARG